MALDRDFPPPGYERLTFRSPKLPLVPVLTLTDGGTVTLWPLAVEQGQGAQTSGKAEDLIQTLHEAWDTGRWISRG